MKLYWRKKKELAGRRVSDTSASSAQAPIVRYYRPQRSVQRSTSATGKNEQARSLGEAKNAVVSPLKSVGRIVARWMFIGAIVALLVVNVTLSGVSVRVKGSSYSYRTNEQYQQIIKTILSSRATFLTKATLSSSALEAEIKKQLPEVRAATAIIPLAGRRLQVVLEVSNPLARLQTGTNKLSVISSAGVVTTEDTTETINAHFIDLPSLSMIGITPQVGSQLLTQSETALIELLSKEFDGSEATRPKVQSLEFDVKKREIKVRFKDKPYYAKVTPEQESGVQVGALVKTIAYLGEQGTTQPTEYIDVRVEDRVFVR